jgi:hypothetical protein
LTLAVVALATLASAGPAEQNGTFALLGGTPQIVSEFWATHGTGLTYRLNVQQFTKAGAPIKAYDVDMQHFMHLVVVRDDFATFAHKHPAYNTTTGAFEENFTKERNHRYYVFADTVPKGVGQQVFRFLLESDGPYAMYKLSADASANSAPAGPYTVTLATTTVAANAPHVVDLTVEKGDDPAEDLVPYLGAAGHVVMIDMSTLEYIHVHPTLRGQATPQNASMNSPRAMKAMTGSGKAGPFMKMELPPLPAGSYKTWVQISGGKDLKVYTAPFTIVAK